MDGYVRLGVLVIPVDSGDDEVREQAEYEEDDGSGQQRAHRGSLGGAWRGGEGREMVARLTRLFL